MSMQIQTTATIRQRKQLTIPDSIADRFDWAQPGSVVTIKTTEKQIIVEPYEAEKKPDWDEFWKDLKRIRSYKGKSKSTMSSTEFLVKDRETHF